MNDLSSLYSEIGSQLIRYAVSFTKQTHSAEDIVSETFLRATEHCIVKGNIPSRAWFYKVTRNIAIDWIRRKRGEDYGEIPEIVDNSKEVNPCQSLEHRENVENIRNAIDHLPETYKSILILREYSGLSYLEIAGVMGVSVDNVKVLLYRAKQKLKEIYKRRNNHEL